MKWKAHCDVGSSGRCETSHAESFVWYRFRSFHIQGILNIKRKQAVANLEFHEIPI